MFGDTSQGMLRFSRLSCRTGDVWSSIGNQQAINVLAN